MKEGYDVDASDPLFSKNVLAGMHKEDKIRQQELKLNRVKANDPSKGEFMGPWAGQQDEQFENIQMNQEQQQLLDQLEEQRKQKIDESKKQEENFVPYMEQHVSQAEQFGGRQFIAPPPELKYVDHTCYCQAFNLSYIFQQSISIVNYHMIANFSKKAKSFYFFIIKSAKFFSVQLKAIHLRQLTNQFLAKNLLILNMLSLVQQNLVQLFKLQVDI